MIEQRGDRGTVVGSRRADEIEPFFVMEVMERAEQLERQGRDIVHMEVGEPDFDVPPSVAEAMIQAIRDGETHYTHSLGLWQLREEIAAYYQRTYRVEVSPARVIVTAGTSGAFMLVLGALLDQADRLVVADPGYPCYPHFARFLCAETVRVPVVEQERFVLRPERVKEQLDGRAKAILVSSPANPTGAVVEESTLAALCNLGPALISDEIYHGLVYGVRTPTALEFSNEAFVIDGFSKRYAMTGLRLGWTVVPDRFVRPINKLSQNLYITVSTPAQRAGIVALREAADDVQRMVATYAERRAYLLAALRRMGIGVAVDPPGAFYIFGDVSPFAEDSFDLALRILEEASVAVTPGRDFGRNETHRYIRFAYTTSLERIQEGVRRLESYLPSVGRSRSAPR